MDLTEGTQREKEKRSKKMMLWFGIGSLIMSFAAWISAFIVSKKQRLNKDWLSNYELPEAFLISIAVIVVSSLTFIMAKRALKKGDRFTTTVWLLITFILGIVFIVSQFQGFNQIIQGGHYFTGPSSNITVTYIYLIAAVHLAHVAVGLLCIAVVIYNHFKQKYTATEMLGLELAGNFWHFVDILWIALFLFLYFYT